jgi:hypothetical protein
MLTGHGALGFMIAEKALLCGLIVSMVIGYDRCNPCMANMRRVGQAVVRTML